MNNIYIMWLNQKNQKVNKKYVLSELSGQEVLAKLKVRGDYQIKEISISDIDNNCVSGIPFTLVS